jgi:hypothetical protein
MERELYRSRIYTPDKVRRRYLEYRSGDRLYRVSECLENGLTIRMVETDGAEGLDAIAMRAARAGPGPVRIG